jgi:hypothetical protein
MRDHQVLRDSSFVRGQMRSRYRATDYWPDIYRQIIRTNPPLKAVLRSYEPGSLPQ